MMVEDGDAAVATTIERVLVAVDDSTESMAAARLAVELAAGWTASVLAVTVLTDGTTAAALGRGGAGHPGHPAASHPGGPAESAAADLRTRRQQAARAVLDSVAGLGRRHGVAVRTELLEGVPARRILAVASSWPADLVVLGRSRRASALGGPYVGSQAQHIIELSGRPVLVVPPAAPPR